MWRVRQPNVSPASPAFVSNSSVVIIASRRPWFFSARVFHVKFMFPLYIYFHNRPIEIAAKAVSLHTALYYIIAACPNESAGWRGQGTRYTPSQLRCIALAADWTQPY